MTDAREAMRADVRDGVVRLLSPGVGLFTCAAERGRVLTAGEVAGELLVLGRAIALVVPEGVIGVVRGVAPERVREPVDWSTALYELDPLDAAGGTVELAALEADASDSSAPVLRAPQTGRFWHRSAPGEPALVEPGAVIADGDAVGLIEVMKTFTAVPYRPGGSLPGRARVVRVVAGDGEDVVEGDALLEVEPADS